MREIKFRAWDDLMKIYVSRCEMTDITLNFYGDQQCCSLSDMVFQQYTGLKDKNGIEIYEGDFIRFGKMEGLYSDQMYPIVAATHPIVRNYSHLGEVIGNIFETPELLEA